MAQLVFLFFIYILLEALDHAISSCLVPSEGDHGNRTPAASSARERFIHNAIAARAGSACYLSGQS